MREASKSAAGVIVRLRRAAVLASTSLLALSAAIAASPASEAPLRADSPGLHRTQLRASQPVERVDDLTVVASASPASAARLSIASPARNLAPLYASQPAEPVDDLAVVALDMSGSASGAPANITLAAAAPCDDVVNRNNTTPITNANMDDSIAGIHEFTLDTNPDPTTTAATTVTNSAAITVSGDFMSRGPIGIAAYSTAHDVNDVGDGDFAATTINNSGAITTNGLYAYGIKIFTLSGGDFDFMQGFHDIPSVTTAEARNVITNSGDIASAGYFSTSVASIARASAADGAAIAYSHVDNTASITGDNIAFSHALTSYAGAYATGAGSAAATSIITNSGDLTTTGVASGGIEMGAGARVNFAPGTSTAIVINSGDITSTSLAATGIGVHRFFVGGGNNTVTIDNSGIVTGGYGTLFVPEFGLTFHSGGIVVDGRDVSIVNSGTVQAAAGAAEAPGHDAIVVHADGDASLTNSGVIVGKVTLRGGEVVSGDVNMSNSGDWAIGGGHSDFTNSSGGASTLTNTGRIVVAGTQTLEGLTTFDNRGLLSLVGEDSAEFNGAGPAHLAWSRFETFEISGDFVGNAGSTLVLGGCDGGECDALEIVGTVSGQTAVVIKTIGGQTPTTGSGNLVISANGYTSPDNFELVGNTSAHTAVSGGYEFNLDFAANGAGGDWYLQSQVFPGVYQFGQISSSALMATQTANGSLLDLLDGRRPVADQAGNAAMQRPVQVASNDPNFAPPTPEAGKFGVWVQASYDDMSVEPDGPAAANFDFTGEAVRFGMDYAWRTTQGTFGAGVYVASVDGRSNFDNFGDARITTDGVAYAVYGIWLNGPWQAGLRVNYDALESTITDNYLGTHADVEPNTWGVEGAVSYDVPLSNDLVLQPQIDLRYASVDGVSFIDGAGDLVDVSDTTSYQARVRARLRKTWQADATRITGYLDAALIYDGDGKTDVTIGGDQFQTEFSGTSGAFGGGVDVAVSRSLSLFAGADYYTGERLDGWKAMAGLRWAFAR